MTALVDVQLQPEKIWSFFAELTQIPRPSKHEQAVIDWIVAFAEARELAWEQDSIGNVIVRKSAMPGCEHLQTAILQSHIDMVPQKNAETKHDFLVDPIKAYVDGDWVKADGTTLGADNGMGVAAMMAVLDASDIQHGPIEALFTIDEEAGMTGAMNLDPGMLKGSLLFNLDTEDDGELYVGCAGGVDVNVDFDYEPLEVPADVNAWQLSVKGLLGGHSGVDIHLTRGNANKLLNRVIRKLLQAGIELNVADIKGGSLRNAIAREAFATLLVPDFQEDELITVLDEIAEEIAAEWQLAEPNLSITVVPTKSPADYIPLDDILRLLRAIDATPHGVTKMSVSLPGIVETSNNLGVIRAGKSKIKVRCLVRSLMDSARDEFCEEVAAGFYLAGANVSFTGAYPGWAPKMDSPLLKAMSDTHEDLFGFAPKVKVIHAGLECGILGAIYPNWDMISFGPTIRGAHSPDERVEIAAVARFWDLLKAALERVPAA
ncbi:aminoacyl-histidine dipeptidase [Umboniibacter marinipuniceus]|uniref:Cytosol non-specific dipeptidase n=1 Tax=Umboniibacter marinipuniceus TaxID=569599 RepID=A0A3M0A472_9GAMM|nr:aminoacyl-histidine dipeptidase [Umboniibacter marinipuniceus]RMA79427.1 Xaa-His dipeptidase [Umboniibacter marinipuniceus]